ncbi:MAG: DUF4293 domain-containing protein [Saprospiraceae bacterium]
MIQRIQSIFLFLAAGSALGLFGLPIATTSDAQEASALFADKAFTLQDNLLLLIAFGAAGLLFLLAIFLFKNRKLQMSLTMGSLVITLLGVAIIGYFYFTDPSSAAAQPAVGIALPLVSVVFAILAHKNISKDDNLVKSMDRLR